jgi:hypothetical protein
VELEERAVPALVDCLTNAEPTRVTVETRPVPLGVMCYEALHLTVSYEHTGPDGGLDPDWPGYVEPTAQSEDLVRAKQAWLDVVGSKAYRIP